MRKYAIPLLGVVLCLVAVSIVFVAAPRVDSPYTIDTSSTRTFGLTPSELQTYRVFNVTPLLGSPYVYCEFHHGAWAWTSVDGDYDLERIIVLIDTDAGRRILRMSWHDRQRFGMGGMIGSSDRTDPLPVLLSVDHPAVLLIRNSWSLIARRGTGMERFLVDRSGAIEAAPTEFVPQAQPMGVDDYRSGPQHSLPVTQNQNRRFAKIQPDTERLLFYHDGTLGTVRPDGTGVMQVFPKPDVAVED